MRGRSEHATCRRDDRELDAARATDGQKLLEQRLVQLAARNHDSIDAPDDLAKLRVQLRATRDPAADLGVNVREELELPHDGLSKRPLPHDEYPLRRGDPAPQAAQRRAEQEPEA